jgi:hypothetical protein
VAPSLAALAEAEALAAREAITHLELEMEDLAALGVLRALEALAEQV